MRHAKAWALAPLMVLTLAACGGDKDKAAESGTVAAPSSKTLAAAIGDQGDLDTLQTVVDNAGLKDVLEGRGPYTVFAPANSALTSAADLSAESMKAQSAALLRAHIVPGALTRADILAAIGTAGSGGAKMRTMSDGLLTFTKDGEVIVVTAQDGATAHLTGSESVVSNGVVQPVDAVLVKAG